MKKLIATRPILTTKTKIIPKPCAELDTSLKNIKGNNAIKLMMNENKNILKKDLKEIIRNSRSDKE